MIVLDSGLNLEAALSMVRRLAGTNRSESENQNVAYYGLRPLPFSESSNI